MNEDRLFDLYNKAYSSNIPVFTNFLNLQEQSLFNSKKNQFKNINFDLFGGFNTCERKILGFFPNYFETQYLDFPYDIIKILPRHSKFTDKLTHRDYLGSVMNLGIERELIGDILTFSDYGLIICKDHISNFIISELTIVKNTMVNSEIIMKKNLLDYTPDVLDMKFSVPSIRLDTLISGAFSLSRSNSISLITKGKAYVNGLEILKNHYLIKPDDIISLRGYGKFLYCGNLHTTKKNRIIVNIKKYI